MPGARRTWSLLKRPPRARARRGHCDLGRCVQWCLGQISQVPLGHSRASVGLAEFPVFAGALVGPMFGGHRWAVAVHRAQLSPSPVSLDELGSLDLSALTCVGA